MIKEVIDSYRKHFGFIDHVFIQPDVCDSPVESISEKNGLLDAVYSLDPVTKLPTGDIACYLSPNTSSEVKKFVLDNIMMDTSSAAMPSIPDGIDEDTAFALTRQQGEHLDNYLERLNDYTNKQVELRDMMIEDAKKQASKNSEVDG